MTALQYILPLVISAFTGWIVIRLSITFLFRPLKPWSVAGFKIQGIIPANQQQVAEKIGKLVSAEMFSMNTLQQKAADPENFNKLKPEIEMHIDQFLRVRLKDTFPMLSMLMGDKTINQLKTAFLLELENLFPVLMKNYITTLEKDLDIEKTVTQKIAGFPVPKMEELFYISAKKQLCKAQLAGALIGLLMGLIHILINTQLYS
ncbi:MAG: DUF445 domain-containing protein [Chitinophagaceae bacterium]|nr:DUF445 domain-containing protein [Chitinophagaceae bacterium]HQW93739.1 DUF445 domain-containing protein [Ferruginibacter sp.]